LTGIADNGLGERMINVDNSELQHHGSGSIDASMSAFFSQTKITDNAKDLGQNSKGE
jgi:hypothetical protein